jgi:hypothetical protein
VVGEPGEPGDAARLESVMGTELGSRLCQTASFVVPEMSIGKDGALYVPGNDGYLFNFLCEGKGGAMLSNEGYARSWSLCYYLMKKKSKELPKYVALIRKRTQRQQITPEQDLQDFESCFGKVNETFSKKYTEFITKLPYRARQ